MDRAAVLAYRLRAHDLVDPAGQPGVLDVGVQDTPPGSTAPLALRIRGARAADPYADRTLALVHGVRGTMHLHRLADLPLLAAALRPDDAADLLPHAHGPFFTELAAQGRPVGEVFDAVADAMRRVMSDGAERTKGELSTAVTPLVPEPLAPWCGGCGVRHVHDGLFRMATLQAGLRLRPNGRGGAVFLPPAGGGVAGNGDPAAARRDLVRRFLHRSGAAGPDALAAWLGLAAPAARRWWKALADELVEVDVEGRRLWSHTDDVERMAGARRAPGVWLLPPYDPIVELADRALLIPDAARRRLLWRSTANPGALLVDGEIAGVWRQRSQGGAVTVTVKPFADAPAAKAVRAAAEALIPGAEVTLDQTG